MRVIVLFVWLIIAWSMAITSLWWRHDKLSEIGVNVQASESGETIGEYEKARTNSPQSMKIPDIDVELVIKEAVVEGNDWTIHDNAASWLATSGDIVSGNTVVYAHNQREAFQDLKKLDTGAEVILESETMRATYELTRSFEGKATDISYITDQDNRLTLYTCSGPLDLKRFFVLAEMVKLEKK